MRPELVIFSTPILHLCPRVVKGHEPVSVQALGAELAIKTLDVAVVSRLAWQGEVEHDTLVIGPKIKVSRDEFAAVIDANGRRISDLPADPLQCLKRASTAGEKREKVSTTVRTLILRPVASWP